MKSRLDYICETASLCGDQTAVSALVADCISRLRTGMEVREAEIFRALLDVAAMLASLVGMCEAGNRTALQAASGLVAQDAVLRMAIARTLGECAALAEVATEHAQVTGLVVPGDAPEMGAEKPAPKVVLQAMLAAYEKHLLDQACAWAVEEVSMEKIRVLTLGVRSIRHVLATATKYESEFIKGHLNSFFADYKARFEGRTPMDAPPMPVW